VAAIVEEFDAIGPGVLDRVGIQILVERIAAIVAAAQGLGFDGPGTFHPGAFVDLVDEEIAENAAAGPEEGMEVADLVKQFADALGLGRNGAAAGAHAVGAHGDDVADLAGANAVEQFLAGTAMADHQADTDLEVLLHGG